MANALYEFWKNGLLQLNASNTFNLSTNTIKVALSRASYTSTDQYYSSVIASTVTGTTPAVIGSKSFSNGVFSGGNVSFTAVPTGAAITSLIIYSDSGLASSSPLIAFIDANVTNLPVTPNGGDIAITWNISGIFKL